MLNQSFRVMRNTLLFLFMTFAFSPLAKGETVADFSLTLDGDSKTATIESYNGQASEITIPAKFTYDGEDYNLTSVKSLGSKDEVKTVVFEKIDQDVTFDQNAFFGLSNLKKIDMRNISQGSKVTLDSFKSCQFANSSVKVVFNDVITYDLPTYGYDTSYEKAKIYNTYGNQVLPIPGYSVYNNTIRYVHKSVLGFPEGVLEINLPDVEPGDEGYFEEIYITENNNDLEELPTVNIHGSHIKSIDFGPLKDTGGSLVFTYYDSYLRFTDQFPLDGKFSSVSHTTIISDDLYYAPIPGNQYTIAAIATTAKEVQLTTMVEVDFKKVTSIHKMKKYAPNISTITVVNSTENDPSGVADTIMSDAFDNFPGTNVIISGQKHEYPDRGFIKMIHTYNLFVDKGYLKTQGYTDSELDVVTLFDYYLDDFNYNDILYDGNVIDGVEVVGYVGTDSEITIPATIDYNGLKVPVVGVKVLGEHSNVSKITFQANDKLSSVDEDFLSGLNNLDIVDISNVSLETFKDVNFGEVNYVIVSQNDMLRYKNKEITLKSGGNFNVAQEIVITADVVASGDIYITKQAFERLGKDIRLGVYSADNSYTFYLTEDVSTYASNLVLKSNWTFDGCGNTVTVKDQNPLFGTIENGAKVRNLIVTGTIDDDISEHRDSEAKVAMIAHINNGTIDRCLVLSPVITVTNETEEKNSITGAVAARNAGTISNCAVFDLICTLNTGSVTSSNVFGGLCGVNEGTVADSYVYTASPYTITGTVRDFNDVSYLVGNGLGTLSRCWAVNTSVEGNSISAETMQTSFITTDEGDDCFMNKVSDKSKWYMSTDASKAYNGYAVPYFGLGDDEAFEAGEILISAQSLNVFSRRVQSGQYKEGVEYHFKLIEDVTLSNTTADWGKYDNAIKYQEKVTWGAKNSIVLKSGWTFDGQGHTIRLNDTMHPFCSMIEKDAELSNIYICGNTNSETGMPLSAGGNSGFVTENRGKILRCVINYDLNVDNSANIDDNIYVGGITGINGKEGTIDDCAVALFSVDVKNTPGETSSIGYISGWTGYNYGNIGEGYSWINVTLDDNSDKHFVVSNIAPMGNFNEQRIYGVGAMHSASDGDNNLRIVEESDIKDGVEFISRYFNGSLAWTPAVNADKYSEDIIGLPIPVMADIELVKTVVDETTGETIIQTAIKDSTTMVAVAELIAGNPALYEGAIITLEDDVRCESILSDDKRLEDVDVDNMFDKWIAIGSADHPFNATFDGEGHTIENLAYLSDNSAFFGTIGEKGKVKNLTIKDAIFAADDKAAVEDDSNASTDGYTTRWIGVLAQENRGVLEDCLFVGDVVLPEDADTTGVKWCLVADNASAKDDDGNILYEGVMKRCLGYFTNIEYVKDEGDNKRQIIVSQNIGAGRNGGKKSKTATNGKKKKLKPNKTIVVNEEEEFDEREINSEYRMYTDEEMATGEPAYWMNWNEDGYTGEYKRIWSRGIAYPVKAKVKDDVAVNPIVKVVYEIEGLSAEDAILANVTGEHYANETEELIVGYDKLPTEIIVTGADDTKLKLTPGETSTTIEALPKGYTLKSEDGKLSHIVTITLNYAQRQLTMFMPMSIQSSSRQAE